MKLMIDEKDIYVCLVNREHEFKALTKNLLENITKRMNDFVYFFIMLDCSWFKGISVH